MPKSSSDSSGFDFRRVDKEDKGKKTKIKTNNAPITMKPKKIKKKDVKKLRKDSSSRSSEQDKLELSTSSESPPRRNTKKVLVDQVPTKTDTDHRPKGRDNWLRQDPRPGLDPVPNSDPKRRSDNNVQELVEKAEDENRYQPTELSPDHKMVDLTHPIATFKAKKGNNWQPDIKRPWGHSKLNPTLDDQVVLSREQILLPEGCGTHIITPATFRSDGKDVEQLTVYDITGPMVVVKLTKHVNRELANPKPDFSNNSKAVVSAHTVDKFAEYLKDGIWVVIVTGWSKFWQRDVEYDDDHKHHYANGPYVNNYNWPGMTEDAIERLIGLERQRDIKINGIICDTLSIENGQSFRHNAHRKGLEQGWKLVVNATNLTSLLDGKGSSIIVGAIPFTGSCRSPVRLLALVNN